MKNKILYWIFPIFCLASVSFANGVMQLGSTTIEPNAFVQSEQVFNGFGCSGQNISPQLEWKNPPKNTQSFALTVYDPDAPTGSGWWHWVVFDIPKDIRNLPLSAGDMSTNLLPKGAIQSITDFGGAGYGGPCPPVGDKPHRYVFTLYALNVSTLGLDAKAMPALVGFMIHDKVLASSSFTVRFGR